MSTGNTQKAQKPAPKNSARARPSKVKGQPRHPERNKLRRDGTLSLKGDGGGRPRNWTDQEKLQFMVEGREWILRRRKKFQSATIVGFCDRMNVWRERVHEWSKESEILAEAYGRMKQAAEVTLLEHGQISRNFVFHIFQLRACHGYSETAEDEDLPEAAPYEPPKK
jgi:hypothetical protein